VVSTGSEGTAQWPVVLN